MNNLHLSNKKSSDFFPTFLQNYCICFKVLNYDAEYALVFQTAHTPQIVIAEGGELHTQTHAHTPVLGLEGFLAQSPFPPKSAAYIHPVSEHLLGGRCVLWESDASFHYLIRREPQPL